MADQVIAPALAALWCEPCEVFTWFPPAFEFPVVCKRCRRPPDEVLPGKRAGVVKEDPR